MSPSQILKNEMLGFMYSQKKRHGVSSIDSLSKIRAIITEIENEGLE